MELESFLDARANKVLREMPESLFGDKELLKLTLMVLLISTFTDSNAKEVTI